MLWYIMQKEQPKELLRKITDKISEEMSVWEMKKERYLWMDKDSVSEEKFVDGKTLLSVCVEVRACKNPYLRGKWNRVMIRNVMDFRTLKETP